MSVGPQVKNSLSLSDLMKLEFSVRIFETYSNIKFQENPPSESRVVQCGRTDRHAEVNICFPQFCKRV